MSSTASAWIGGPHAEVLAMLVMILFAAAQFAQLPYAPWTNRRDGVFAVRPIIFLLQVLASAAYAVALFYVWRTEPPAGDSMLRRAALWFIIGIFFNKLWYKWMLEFSAQAFGVLLALAAASASFGIAFAVECGREYHDSDGFDDKRQDMRWSIMLATVFIAWNAVAAFVHLMEWVEYHRCKRQKYTLRGGRVSGAAAAETYQPRHRAFIYFSKFKQAAGGGGDGEIYHQGVRASGATMLFSVPAVYGRE